MFNPTTNTAHIYDKRWWLYMIIRIDKKRLIECYLFYLHPRTFKTTQNTQ